MPKEQGVSTDETIREEQNLFSHYKCQSQNYFNSNMLLINDCRDNNRVTNANDEMKAFQIALLRRIGVVKEQSKLAAGTRPLMNLGKYGGATVEYIKSESEKYKRIRDPKRRRLIKAKISLEQVFNTRL